MFYFILITKIISLHGTRNPWNYKLIKDKVRFGLYCVIYYNLYVMSYMENTQVFI